MAQSPTGSGRGPMYRHRRVGPSPLETHPCGGKGDRVDRLTPLAASFLEAEDVDATASLAIGSLAIFEGPTPDFDEFVASIAGRLPLIPRYRQKVRRVVLDLAAPAWVDAPDFDLAWHVRRTALPAPGGRREVERLFSRVMTRRMDRRRPLWEYWFCEGLAGGRWALLSKIHHSMVDGVSGSDLYRLVLDASPVSAAPLPDDWQPEPPASGLSFTTAAILDLATSPAHALRGAATALSSPRRFVRSTAGTALGMWRLAAALRPVHHTSLTGSL